MCATCIPRKAIAMRQLSTIANAPITYPATDAARSIGGGLALLCAIADRCASSVEAHGTLVPARDDLMALVESASEEHRAEAAQLASFLVDSAGWLAGFVTNQPIVGALVPRDAHAMIAVVIEHDEPAASHPFGATAPTGGH